MSSDWISAWLEQQRAELERRLDQAVPAAELEPTSLHRAMRYSLLGRGKRLRPLLVLAAAHAIVGAEADAPPAWGPACAVEMVHAYSLIHDDLPALDNDELRRGQPTCHKAFGEALAILAGDALLTLAFAQLPLAGMAVVLARAAGTPLGMVAGQVQDLEAVRELADLERVRAIHRAKTAALIGASLELGAMAAGANDRQREALRRFGRDIGLAFQITDDLLDLTASSAELGKTPGKDERQRKATYPALLGAEASAREARQLAARARSALDGWGPGAEPLLHLAARMTERRA